MPSLYVNPESGGYELVDGALLQEHPSVIKANMLLLQPIGTYVYDTTMGNPLVNYQGNLTKANIINGLTTCLTPLLKTNDLVNFSVTKLELTLTKKWKAYITALLPDGNIAVLNWKQK